MTTARRAQSVTRRLAQHWRGCAFWALSTGWKSAHPACTHGVSAGCAPRAVRRATHILFPARFFRAFLHCFRRHGLRIVAEVGQCMQFTLAHGCRDRAWWLRGVEGRWKVAAGIPADLPKRKPRLPGPVRSTCIFPHSFATFYYQSVRQIQSTNNLMVKSFRNTLCCNGWGSCTAALLSSRTTIMCGRNCKIQPQHPHHGYTTHAIMSLNQTICTA